MPDLATTTTPADAPSAPTWTRPSSLAATVAILAERTTNKKTRQSLRTAADRLVSGEDLDTVTASLSTRLKTLFRTGRDHNCLTDLLRAALDVERSRSDRSRAVWSLLAYPVIVFITTTVFLVGVLAFAWFYLRPIERDVAETFNWIRTTTPDLYLGLLTFAATFAAIATTVVALGFLAVSLSKFRDVSRPIWMSWIPNGRAVAIADSEEEMYRMLAVFVQHERPLPESFDAIHNVARSAFTKRWATSAAEQTAAGQPIEKSLAHRPVPPRVFQPAAPTLSAEALTGAAQLAAVQARVDAERGAYWVRFFAIALAAFLLVIAMSLIMTPAFIHIRMFSMF